MSGKCTWKGWLVPLDWIPSGQHNPSLWTRYLMAYYLMVYPFVVTVTLPRHYSDSIVQ